MNAPVKTCSYPGCGRPVHQPPSVGRRDTCFFHGHEKDPLTFRKELARLIREWRNAKAENWDFSGFVFVDRPKKSNLFCHARFPRPVSFQGARFTQDAHFEGARFTQNANFEGARFTQNAYFSLARFTQNAYFEEATFTQNAYFEGATFTQDAYFEEATFTQNAYFAWATFTQNAYFGGATFTQDADFEKATFTQNAYFAWATFTQNADFEEATIQGCLILRRVQFRQTEPNHTLRFKSLNFEGQGIIDFRDNDLNNNCAVIVRDCNIGRMLFAYTDVRQIRFENVGFERTRDSFFIRFGVYRKVIGDEWVRRHSCNIEESVKPDWPAIEITYQRFAKAFRDNYNHPSANDCERGYFESRRETALGKGRKVREERQKGWWRTWLLHEANAGLITAYKYSSHYSGSLSFPFGWLFVSTLLIWPALYCIFMSGPDSFTAALRVASLNREPISLNDFVSWDRFWISLIVALQLVCTAAFVTLFILALRRRFKHGE